MEKEIDETDKDALSEDRIMTDSEIEMVKIMKFIREGLILLRDQALTIANFEDAVSLSHLIAAFSQNCFELIYVKEYQPGD